jgi:hypothetical protein
MIEKDVSLIPQSCSTARTKEDGVLFDLGQKTPIVVVGAPRSGTTLLCAILNRHPDVYVCNELPWSVYTAIDKASGDLGHVIHDLSQHQHIADLESAVEAGPRSPLGIAGTALRLRALALQKKRWGVKDPTLTNYLPQFQEAFPLARIVVIIRDARAVTHSILQRKTYIANSYHSAIQWNTHVEKQLEFYGANPQHVLLLRYEDFVAQPVENTERLCEFFGIAFSEHMLDHDLLMPFKRNEFNDNVFRPIDSGKAEAWKVGLTLRQISTIEAVSGPLLKSLGYELTRQAKAIWTLHRSLYGLHQFVVSNYRWHKRTKWARLRFWKRPT